MGYEEDKELAERVCRELPAGNHRGFELLMTRYREALYGFAYWHVYDRNDLEDVLQSFWLSLFKGRSICAYRAESSLKTYLIEILKKQVYTANGRREKVQSWEVGVDEIDEVHGVGGDAGMDSGVPEPGGWGGDRGEIPGDLYRLPPEKIVGSAQEREKVDAAVRRALTMLSEKHPECAEIVWARLTGLQYQEMAAVALGRATGGGAPDPVALGKKTDALKKRNTRSDAPGCMTRFRKIVMDLLLRAEDGMGGRCRP